MTDAEVRALIEAEFAKKSSLTASISVVSSPKEYRNTFLVGSEYRSHYLIHQRIRVNCSDSSLTWIPLYWFTTDNVLQKDPYTYSTRFPYVFLSEETIMLWDDSDGTKANRTFPASSISAVKALKGVMSYMTEKHFGSVSVLGGVEIRTTTSSQTIDDPENPGTAITNAIPVFKGTGTISLYCRSEINPISSDHYFVNKNIYLGVFRCPDLSRQCVSQSLLLDSIAIGTAKRDRV
jgi:hypothetical protein